ncbi:hypothetical protein SCLARK_0099 [Spiroplasma clarkii]|uniref:DUF1904 domain-containing protein n=1 Tax=Spiroplasma clarkii TaxID=2139 RepID=A0A1Y0KYU6_9MOLU|nr:DUF1904 family protein [Spiroplasma clarkii]ARU90903.1 hypothetical protein SCLARK_0099 [Spiroplasma clarkii]ATX70353.1 hypothetical protein SCLAR_v1c00160 [Spiroplasma clarkii]
MPILSFRGVPEDRVQEYFKKAGELAQMINSDVKNVVFWHEPSKLIGNGYDKDAILVTIDWIGRPLKQEAVAKHICDFFANDSKHIYIKFTEINHLLYLNTELVG